MSSYNQKASADARVSQINVNANYGSEAQLWIGEGSGGQIDRIFLKFDLSSIPPYSTIQSAVLRFFQYDGANDWLSPTIGIQAHPVNADWSEGGITWNNQPYIWDVPSGETSFSNNIGSSVDIDVLSPISFMVANPASVFGLRVVSNNSASSTRKEFRSREYGTEAQRPTLIIEYIANTAPYWPEGASISPGAAGIIPENTASLTPSWTAAVDDQGNTKYYTLYRNGTLIASGLTDTSFVDNIGAGNPGSTYQYAVYVNDGIDSQPTPLTSAVVTKNTFTMAALNHTGDILFATATIPMSHTTPTNTNGNTSFTYDLMCDLVPVYNPMVDLASYGNVLTIWRTGGYPSGPYIKFTELKAALASASYHGYLTFTLAVENAYGSMGTETESVIADIRTYPTGLGAPSYSGGYTLNSVLRYLPDQRAVTLNWAAATDPLGTAITYDVYYKLTSAGTWTQARAGLSALTTTISPPSADTQQAYNVKVVAKSAYNYTAEAAGATLLIDKYLRPIIKQMSKTRLQTSVAIGLEIEFRSSFNASLALTVLTYTKLGGAAVSLPLGDLTPDFTYSESGVFLATSAYTMVITAQDTMGAVLGAGSITANIVISKYVPMFDIREKGVAVNAVADSDVYNFMVGGKMKLIDDGVDHARLDINGYIMLAQKSGSLPATPGWYRIAYSPVSIGNCGGTFKIDCSGTGVQTEIIANAGIHFGSNPFIEQLHYSRYLTNAGINKLRIVYHATYSGNYAYLEVYLSNAVAVSVKVDLSVSLGWELDTIGTVGSIPSGYTSKELTCNFGLVTNGIIESQIPTGSAPLVVASTTKVPNLNADMLDDKHSGDYASSQPNASNAHLGTTYISGGNEKPNHFGGGKLKVNMLSNTNLGCGGWWNDVLWLSGYTGGDVPGCHALVFDKYADEIYDMRQNMDATAWGTPRRLWHSGNLKYSEGTWSPGLYFGWANVGMTYSGQSGTWSKIGNRVFFDGIIILSSKGSSTGQATINNLPFEAASYSPVTFRMEQLACISQLFHQALITPGQYYMRLEYAVQNSLAIMTDGDFANNSIIIMSGNYKTT